MEAVLALHRSQRHDGWLLAEEPRQLGKNFGHHAAARPERLLDPVSPNSDETFGLAQERQKETTKGLVDRRVRRAPLREIELARKEAASLLQHARTQALDERRFSDSGRSAHQHELVGPAERALQRRRQLARFPLPAMNSFERRKLTGQVEETELEGRNRARRLPPELCLLEIGQHRFGALVTLLGHFRQELENDA